MNDLKRGNRLHEFLMPPGTMITIVWNGFSSSVSNGNVAAGIAAARDAIHKHGVAEARDRFDNELSIFEKLSTRALARGIVGLGRKDLEELSNCIVACCVWDYAINGNFIQTCDIGPNTLH
jgi:hypothetical protein